MVTPNSSNLRRKKTSKKQKSEKETQGEDQVTLGLILQRYFIYAYAYYELDKPLVSDAQFDGMAKILLKYWDEFEHRHKHLITKDDLVASTFLGKYPSQAVGAAKLQIQLKGL